MARDPKTGTLKVVEVAEVGEENLVVHDATLEDPSYAFALSRLGNHNLDHTVTGVFRNVQRDTYDDLARHQVAQAKAAKPADLTGLLRGKDTWTVLAD